MTGEAFWGLCRKWRTTNFLNLFVFRGLRFPNSSSGLFFLSGRDKFPADVVHLAGQTWPSCISSCLLTRWVRISPFFNSLPTQQPHQFICECLSGSQPAQHLSAFISPRVQLLLRAAAEETAKTSATEAQMLRPSHSSPPAEPLVAWFVILLSHAPERTSLWRVTVSTEHSNKRRLLAAPPPLPLSLTTGNYISKLSEVSSRCLPACLPLQSINSFQAALSGPKWRSRFSACHNDVNGFERTDKH